MTGPAKRYVFAVVVTVSMFAIWGLAQSIHGSLSPQFERLFHLNAVEIALTDSTVGLAYLFLAIPSAMLLRRLGFKAGVVFGLSGFSLGAFLLYAAIAQHAFLFFVAAAAVIGGSWALLETCANPLIMKMGPPETAVRRLNIAQCFYPVGLLAGFWLAPKLEMSHLTLPGLDAASDVVRPYVVVGLCLLLIAFLVDHIAFPPKATVPAPPKLSGRAEMRSLLAQPQFLWAMAALTAYILAQSCIWAFLARYVPSSTGLTLKLADVVLWTLLLYGAGRFLGTTLMYVFDPDQLLAAYGAVAGAMLAFAATTNGLLTVICLITSGFFMSIMFPTIFGGAIRRIGIYTRSGSGLLVAATGLGVTLAALVMATLWTIAPPVILIICSFCFAVVMVYAVKNGRRSEKAAGDAGRFRTEPPCS